jgi:hypothetical protein
VSLIKDDQRDMLRTPRLFSWLECGQDLVRRVEGSDDDPVVQLLWPTVSEDGERR